MRIVFRTENQFTGQIPRNLDNLRTDLAWMVALDAHHVPLGYAVDSEVDIAIIILPKYGIDNFIKTDFIEDSRKYAKRVLFMQEGPNDFWQDYSLESQILYFNKLSEFDGILCHNEMDKKYYLGHTDKLVETMPSLMIEDNLNLDNVDRSGTMIGGTLCQWYNGMDSLATAMMIGERVYAPSMGRKKPEEDSFNAIEYLPYLKWLEWIQELNKRRYGVHLMRTFAAGTFALNCAYLGIPCIGYNNVDTQRILFPDLSVDLGDLNQAKQIAKKLKQDESFYHYTAMKSKQLYRQLYREDSFLKKMNRIFNKVME